MKIKVSIVDNDGVSYHGEMQLIRSKMTKKSNVTTIKSHRKKTTSDKITDLIDSGYLDTTRTISDIVMELKTHDYHFKSSDLTWPLRTLVRQGYLRKTKNLPNSEESKHWMYIRSDIK